MTPGPRSCPHCGALNRGTASACYLCASAFPGAAPLLSFYEAADENARKARILFASLAALLLLLGALAGHALGSPWTGIALGAVLFAILGATAWFSGAPVVLSAHGAREAEQGAHATLLNVVAEMAIASGVPPPRAFVMESDGMNAFAAGRRPGEGIVAVTTGLLSGLSREELQGVVAHEMAHIKSRDTLYNVCAAVLVGSVALLADAFLRGLPFRGRPPEAKGRGSAALFLFGILFALVAPLAARILQMSVSRQREYHADAAAARFTRHPLALASALEKIAASGPGVPGANRGTQHLFIVNPLQGPRPSAPGLLATHPPIDRRIQRLKAMAGLRDGDPPTGGSVGRPREGEADVATGHHLREGHLTVHHRRS